MPGSSRRVIGGASAGLCLLGLLSMVPAAAANLRRRAAHGLERGGRRRRCKASHSSRARELRSAALRAGSLLRSRTGGSQEVPDHCSDLAGMGQEEEVAPASYHVQPGIRN